MACQVSSPSNSQPWPMSLSHPPLVLALPAMLCFCSLNTPRSSFSLGLGVSVPLLGTDSPHLGIRSPFLNVLSPPPPSVISSRVHSLQHPGHHCPYFPVDLFAVYLPRLTHHGLTSARRTEPCSLWEALGWTQNRQMLVLTQNKGNQAVKASLVVQWLRLCSQRRRPRFHPLSGNDIPHAVIKTQHSQKKKKRTPPKVIWELSSL